MRQLVALDLPGGAEFVEEMKRVWDAGDAVLPLDVRLGPPLRRRLVEIMGASRVVTGSGVRDRPGGSPVDEGDALVMVTSGTTGEPKGVVLTHEAVAASARATSARLGVDSDHDAWWACLPLSHVGGLSVVTRSLIAGVRCEVTAGFSPEGAEDALEGGATLVSLVPTALARLAPAVVDRFRRIVLGGQAPPAQLPENVTTTYGMTETGSGLVYDGTPLDGVEVRIADPRGEIEVRGPMLLRAYRDGRDPKDAEGWLATGDAGEIDAAGRLAVHGRIEDMIVSGGENVFPAAVELILLGHPAVTEAAVVGAPDPQWGERVVAVVVTAPGAETPSAGRLLSELRDRVKAELAPFAAPREVIVVDRLPRTAIGKVVRPDLTTLKGESAAI